MRTSVGLAVSLVAIAACGSEPPSIEDPVIGAEPELPESTAAAAVPSATIDFTSHTFSAPSAGVGTFASLPISRTFARPIVSLQLFIEPGGRADDVGFVGSQRVTSMVPACSDVATVTDEIDVTSQVTISGNTASFVLRAGENCCCKTGWGSATQSDRADAVFKWVVTLSPPCGDGTCNGTETCASCPGDCGTCEAPCCPPGSTCLAGDTPVTMANGSSKPIANVMIGERVLSYEPNTGVLTASEVTKTFRHPDADGTVLINGELRATPNHPLFVGGAWKRADELAAGDVLTRLESGATRMMVEPVRIETLQSVGGKLTTYNLEVAGTHNYFAGGYLVHNKTCRVCEPL